MNVKPLKRGQGVPVLCRWSGQSYLFSVIPRHTIQLTLSFRESAEGPKLGRSQSFDKTEPLPFYPYISFTFENLDLLTAISVLTKRMESVCKYKISIGYRF